MKVIKIMKSMGFISCLLFALSIVFGADAAMAAASVTATDPKSSTESAGPVLTNAGTGAIPDSKGMETDLTGTVASATQLREGGLADPEIDEYISKFRPYMFAADTDMRKMAKQRKVTGYEVEHYSSAASNLNGVFKSEISDTDKTNSVVVSSSKISEDGIDILAPYSTISVPGVYGYDTDGTTLKGNLILFVSERTNNSVTIEAINGPKEGGTMYIPNIPANTKYAVCANACSESQMLVSPENYQPKPKIVYLQKKIVNIVLTDHFKEVVKKIPFYEQDVKDDALYNFRRKSARTLWIGVQSRIKRRVSDEMGGEFIYTSEGILNQISNYYAINDELTFADLIALCKMQFTDYSVNNTAEVYCGKNFIEKLLNIDFTKHKDITFTANQTIGIDIHSFKTTFGTLDFKHEQTLDDLGYEDAAAVVDILSATRYIKDEDKRQTVDMKKGAGDNREATRDIHTQIDCLALHGYNSILVGPSKILFSIKSPDSVTVVTSSTTLNPETLTNITDGMIVYLTENDAYSGMESGKLYQYNAQTESWSEYSGIINV